MNKTTIVCVLSFVLMVTAAPAFPLSYEIDFNNDGVWDTEWNLDPPPAGETVSVDVWLDGYSSPPLNELLGAELYFYYDHTKITVNELNSFPNDNLHGGPFDNALSFFDYLEDGVYALTVSDFMCVEATDGKVKLATIELECIAEGDAVIKASNNLGFGGYTDGFISTCWTTDIQYPSDAQAIVHQVVSPCSETISPQSVTVDSQFPPVIGAAFSVDSYHTCEPQTPVYSDDCISADINPDTGELTVFCVFSSEDCHVFVTDAANPDACNEPDAVCTADVYINGTCPDADGDGITDGLDNCPSDPDNDIDNDTICADMDNCPHNPNSTELGTCVKLTSGVFIGTGVSCFNFSDCKEDEFCQLEQHDTNLNNIGDVCECYADSDNNTQVGLSDLGIMKTEFGSFNCDTTPCDADINSDDNVGLSDLSIMKIQFGRNDCPISSITTSTTTITTTVPPGGGGGGGGA